MEKVKDKKYRESLLQNANQTQAARIGDLEKELREMKLVHAMRGHELQTALDKLAAAEKLRAKVEFLRHSVMALFVALEAK